MQKIDFFSRIAQDDYKTYLKGIQDNSELVTGTLEEMASELQRKFESLVADDKEIYERACKGAYFHFIFSNLSVTISRLPYWRQMLCFGVK